MVNSALKEESFCQNSKKGVILHIKVHPRASKTGIDAITEKYIKISLKAPPVDNEANIELIRYLSKLLEVQKSDIQIKFGQTGKNKSVEITNLDTTKIMAKLV